MYGVFGTQVSVPFPFHGPAHATPPFPRTGPGGPGSPPSAVLRRRYDSPHCIPSAYCFASRYHAVPACSLPVPRRQGRARTLCCGQGSMFRPFRVDRYGASQVPRRAIPWLCARSLTPDDPLRLACSGARGAAPAIIKTKASTLRISRFNSVASPPAVYASRRALPHAMQHSLPAGGLRLCRAGVEPAGSRCKVSAHRILLARACPGAI